MEEIWKDIEGYEGLYQVSNLGRVKSLARTYENSGNYSGFISRKESIVKFSDNDGYNQCFLSKHGRTKGIKVHRLVALAFVENIKLSKQVNHIDGDRKNNVPSNLEWINNNENALHGHLRRGKSSKYPGVSYIKRDRKWYASIYVDKKNKSLGTFHSEEEAYSAYKSALIENKIENKYAFV